MVSMAKASEPEEGSERQKEPTEEVARGGRKVLRRWGEAYFRNAVLTRVFYSDIATMLDLRFFSKGSSPLPPEWLMG